MTMATKNSTKTYPSCCTAAYCGRVDCEGCPNKPTLDAFKSWREQHAAVKSDPIWCPTIWTATK
jgi:hypothetical protein